MEKKKYKKPNAFYYFLFRIITSFISKFVFNTKVIRNELKDKKGPFVVLANHEAALDFINLAAALKQKCHFVISYAFYNTCGIRGILDKVKVIPKQQFQTTVMDIRRMKEVIDNDMPLVIYPVGLMSENGMSEPLPIATSKFVKMLQSDVYVCYTKGSYLTKPKWANKRRKGRITLDIYKLMDKKELNQISNEELQKKLDENLFYDAYQNQEEDLVEYKNGNDIEGLEYVLYKCPKCHKEKVMVVENKDTLVCKECGFKAKANKYGLLENINDEKIFFRHPSKWYQFIYDDLKKQIDEGIMIELENKTIIKQLDYKKQKFVVVGEGIVRIGQENINLEGMINNINISKTFSISNYPNIPFAPKKSIDIQEGNTIYRLCFDDKYDMMKFVVLLKIYHRKMMNECNK